MGVTTPATERIFSHVVKSKLLVLRSWPLISRSTLKRQMCGILTGAGDLCSRQSQQAIKLSGTAKLKKILIIDSLQAIEALINKTLVNYLAAWAHDEMRKARLEKLLTLWIPGHSRNFCN